MPFTFFARARSFFRNLFSHAQVEDALSEELRAHLDLLVAEKITAGATPAAAERAARIEIGTFDNVKEQVRDARQGAQLDTTLRDVRYATRSLLRSPAFTAAAVLALALGIGSTSAIFSVVNSVLLRSLPYRDASRIVMLGHVRIGPVSPANYVDWQRLNSVFSQMGAAESWTATLTSNGDQGPERIRALRVTPSLLPLTGRAPALGRAIAAPGSPGSNTEAVISWDFWQQHFAGDSSVIGKPMTLDGVVHTVVGVMPRAFDFPIYWSHDIAVWAPLIFDPAFAADRDRQSLRVFGRLGPGVTLKQAQAEISTITARLEREYPGTNRLVEVTPLQELVVGDVRPALLVLLGAVAFVLLIACANVAHLLLARAAARQKEMTVRTALGASRARLVRQMLTESLLLSLTGGAVGIAFAALALKALATLGAAELPRADAIGMDMQMVAFTIAVSVVTGIAFGLLPALQASRSDIATSLREAGRGSGGSAATGRARHVLMASEFAVALLLLAGAGLSIRTFIALRAVDAGFDPHGVLSMEITPRGTVEGTPERRVGFYNEVMQRVAALPGVASVGAINHLPLAGDMWGLSFSVEGAPPQRPGDGQAATYRVILPGYFSTMRIPLTRGRDLTDAERTGTQGVVVINEWMAAKRWPGEDPIGKRITLDNPDSLPTWLTVVGVVKNAVRGNWTAPPSDEMYLPYLQSNSYLTETGGHVGYMTLVVRASCAAKADCDASTLTPAIRETVRNIDRNIPVTAVHTMDDVVHQANARPELTLILLGVFAGVALTLAAIGIHGLMSYTVSTRSHEIGVRLALGARPGAVIGLIVKQGMIVAGIGGAVGLAAALALTRLMSGILYGVQAADPLTYVAAIAVLATTALAACYVPAHRATKIDPLKAMRTE